MEDFVPKFAARESNLFPFRVVQFLGGTRSAGRQPGRHISCLPFYKMAKKLPSVTILLKVVYMVRS